MCWSKRCCDCRHARRLQQRAMTSHLITLHLRKQEVIDVLVSELPLRVMLLRQRDEPREFLPVPHPPHQRRECRQLPHVRPRVKGLERPLQPRYLVEQDVTRCQRTHRIGFRCSRQQQAERYHWRQVASPQAKTQHKQTRGRARARAERVMSQGARVLWFRPNAMHRTSPDVPATSLEVGDSHCPSPRTTRMWW